VRWLDSHPYSAQQILQRLREVDFDGGRSIVKDYLAHIRPRQHPAFLKLDFAPGECAQVVALGSYGTIAVGNTRRALSFLVMVLCYSRRMYLEFTVAQTMEFFLARHEHAFAAFGGTVSSTCRTLSWPISVARIGRSRSRATPNRTRFVWPMTPANRARRSR